MTVNLYKDSKHFCMAFANSYGLDQHIYCMVIFKMLETFLLRLIMTLPSEYISRIDNYFIVSEMVLCKIVESSLFCNALLHSIGMLNLQYEAFKLLQIVRVRKGCLGELHAILFSTTKQIHKKWVKKRLYFCKLIS